MKTILGLLLALSVLSGCATTNRNKILQTMAIAGTTGVLYGLSKPNHPEANAVLYGGLAAASAGIAGHLIWNSDKEAERYRLEAESYRSELSHIQTPIEISSSPATFGAAIPKKYRSLVNPGEWRVSAVDEWMEDGENRLIHQDRVMDLIPPSLNPKKSKGTK